MAAPIITPPIPEQIAAELSPRMRWMLCRLVVAKPNAEGFRCVHAPNGDVTRQALDRRGLTVCPVPGWIYREPTDLGIAVVEVLTRKPEEEK